MLKKKGGGGALQNECAILTPFINNRYKTWKTILFLFFKESGIYTLCIIHVPLGLRLILQKQTSVVPPPVPRLISGRNGEKFCSLNKRNNQTALLQENIHEIYRCTLTLKHRDFFFYHFGEFANILIHSLI